MSKQWSLRTLLNNGSHSRHGLKYTGLVIALPLLLIISGCDNNGGGERPSRASNVNAVEPRTDRIRDEVETVGSLAAVQSIDVTAEEDGRIANINFREGQHVEQGTLLVQLDDRQTRASLAEAEAELRNAEARFNRAERLRQSNNISAAEFEELESARAVSAARVQSARTRLDHMRISAPFTGVIGLREVSTGAWLRAGDRITTLDSVDPIELVFSIPERFVGALDDEMSVTARSDAFPGRTFNGEITSLATRVDPLSRSLRLKARLDNSDGRLRPGQYMVINLALRERDALLIPEEAILTIGDKQYVYVAEDGQAGQREIRLGQRRAGEAEIIEGISATDKVIVTGHTRLSDGDPIRLLDDPESLVSGDQRYTPASSDGPASSAAPARGE